LLPQLENVDVLDKLTIMMALAICLGDYCFCNLMNNQPKYLILIKLPSQQIIEKMGLFRFK
jgi:hypothetical protein